MTSRGQCTIKGLGTTRIYRYPVAGRLPRKDPSPSEGEYAEKQRRMQRGECRLVDGPSEVDTEGRNKDERRREKREEGKKEKGERKKRRKKWEVSYSSGWLAPYR